MVLPLGKCTTYKYNADKLMWFEEHDYVWDAIAREKEIKGWRRKKKVKLIESINPDWEDLIEQLLPKGNVRPKGGKRKY